MAMTSEEFGRCVHPREWPRMLLAMFFALPISLLLLAVAFVTFGAAVAIVLFLVFLVWFGFEIVYASLLGNWILVSEDNYPRLHDLLNEMKERIGVTNNIDIIVYDQSHFSSYFRLLFARRAIYVGSDLLAQGVTDDELRWLIGRWVGWIRAKRRLGPLRYVIAVAERLLVFNFFLFPYERAKVYTGDRVGLAAINGDISTAISTMNKLMVGRELGYSVNPAGIVRQYRRVKGSLFAFLARLAWPLPHMTARYVDLIAYAEREYPDAYEQFAAMNPSFQTSGGAMKLMWSTPKRGDGGSNAMGWGLLLGSFATAAVAILFVQQGMYRYLGQIATPASYEATETTTTETTPPAESYEPFSLDQLSPEVAAQAQHARNARAQAEEAAASGRDAAAQGEQAGASPPADGYGALDWGNGNHFAGLNASGWSRLGVDTYGNGEKYEGQYIEGYREGYGAYTWTNNRQYFGHWTHGLRSGHGIQVYSDDGHYEGQWSNDKPNGLGVMWDANGNVENSGNWNDGVYVDPYAAEAAPGTTP